MQVETPEEMRVEMRVERPAKTPQQILQLLQRQPELSMSEMTTLLGKSVSSIERAIARLKQQQLLAFEGPKKAGRWKVLMK